VTAEAEAEVARRAEIDALTAARDRLRPSGTGIATPDGLIVDLGRAAERLRVDAAPASGLRRLVARLRRR
jgi:hypothetical protein